MPAGALLDTSFLITLAGIMQNYFNRGYESIATFSVWTSFRRIVLT